MFKYLILLQLANFSFMFSKNHDKYFMPYVVRIKLVVSLHPPKTAAFL